MTAPKSLEDKRIHQERIHGIHNRETKTRELQKFLGCMKRKPQPGN
jgi:hypothetical protein